MVPTQPWQEVTPLCSFAHSLTDPPQNSNSRVTTEQDEDLKKKERENQKKFSFFTVFVVF